MARFIPPHPKKGSVAAQEWAARMREARARKKRLKHTIRAAGKQTEQAFFGKGGPLEVKPRRNPPLYVVKIVNGKNELLNALGPFPSKEYADKVAIAERQNGYFTYTYKMNPGERWHQGMASVAGRYVRQAQGREEKALFKGMQVAHEDSASAAHKFKMNPIGVYNPPAKPAGIIYNNAIEIRAEKSQNKALKGFYKHAFGSGVQIIGLQDGTVLLKHRKGKRLWISRKDYERSGRRHS